MRDLVNKLDEVRQLAHELKEYDLEVMICSVEESALSRMHFDVKEARKKAHENTQGGSYGR